MGALLKRLVAKMFRQNCGNGISKTDRDFLKELTAFNAQPLDLHSVPLMDVGFVAICQLARTLPASHPVLVHRLASLLRASFRPHLAVGVISPLRFAVTSRPPRCEEDLHLQAVDHARHAKQSGRPDRLGPPAMSLCEMRLVPTERSLETPTRPDSAVN